LRLRRLRRPRRGRGADDRRVGGESERRGAEDPDHGNDDRAWQERREPHAHPFGKAKRLAIPLPGEEDDRTIGFVLSGWDDSEDASRARSSGVARAGVLPAERVPAKLWNHDCSCGYEVAGFSCRWRCGPVAWPVWPTRPTSVPVARVAPAVTAG